jgi:hypothetical protein
MNANQLFRLRHDWRDGLLGEGRSEQRLLPVAEECGPALAVG